MSDDAPSIDGTCDPRFAAVREAFTGNFASGLDVGASVAVALDGEMVVWPSWPDPPTPRRGSGFSEGFGQAVR